MKLIKRMSYGYRKVKIYIKKFFWLLSQSPLSHCSISTAFFKEELSNAVLGQIH
jgi:hypothetical protein